MRKFWIVVGQVYRKNIKSGAWLMLVLAPILFVLAVGGVAWFASNSDAAKTDIAVVTDQPEIVKVLEKADDNPTFKVHSAKEADNLLKKEEVSAVLTVKFSPTVTATFTQRDGEVDPTDVQLITAALSAIKTQQAAGKAGLTQQQLMELTQPVDLKTKTVKIEDGKVAKNGTDAFLKRGLALGLTLFIFIIVLTYGSIVGQEIAIEKGSRVMETLLSSVSAKTQFFGKITGILALFLTQIVLYLIALGIAWPYLSSLKMFKDILGSIDLSFLITPDAWLMYAFFIVGTLTYVVLAALSGSLVSNQEQIQSAMAPVSFLGMFAYVLGFMAQTGDNAIIRIASYVPFLSAGVMPVQRALGQASLTETLISLLIAIVFLGVFGWFSAGMYETNVLVYSDNNFFKRLMRSWRLRKA